MLLAPGCGLAELATVGDGKHLRFRVRRDGRDAGSAIAFGQGSRLEVLRPDALYDVAFRLEENHWNGTVAPQLVVRRVFATAPRYRELREWLAEEWRKPAAARESGSGRDLRGAEPRGRRSPRPAGVASLPRSPRHGAAPRRRRVIRLAREADWPAILEVHRAAFDPEDVPRIAAELHERADLYVPELSFVAEEDGTVVGHVMNTWNG